MVGCGVNLEKLQRIKQEYFSAHSQINIFKSVVTNKNLQVIVNFVHAVISYVLNSKDQEDDQSILDQIPKLTEEDLDSQSNPSNFEETPRGTVFQGSAHDLSTTKSPGIQALNYLPGEEPHYKIETICS